MEKGSSSSKSVTIHTPEPTSVERTIIANELKQSSSKTTSSIYESQYDTGWMDGLEGLRFVRILEEIIAEAFLVMTNSFGDWRSIFSSISEGIRFFYAY